MEAADLVGAGVVLVLLGFALVFAGSLKGGGETEAEAGGVIFIGPIPVVFGSNRNMAFLAAVLGILTLGLLYFFSKGL